MITLGCSLRQHDLCLDAGLCDCECHYAARLRKAAERREMLRAWLDTAEWDDVRELRRMEEW